ncbi:MAG: hypothetical protein JW969_05685 [Spirochaetales bacterium]|nr:hypothetical protein [Spirochaetales bacterium]
MKQDKLTVEKFINLDELVFDIIIATGIVFIGNMVVQQRNFKELLGGEFLPNLLIAIDFMLGYYFSKTAISMVDKNMFKSSELPGLKKLIAPALYAVVACYTLFVLWISLPVILEVPGVFTFVLGIILIILGAMVGLAAGFKSLEPEKDKKENLKETKEKESKFAQYLNEESIARHPSIILPVASFLYVVVFMISLFGDTTGITGILIFILAIVLGIVSIVVSGGVVSGWIILYEFITARLPVMDKIFRNILVPLFFACILVTWEHIYLLSAIDDPTKIDLGKIFFVLFFTGIIPLRIILFFKPPVRIINLVTGAISIAFYIYSVRFLAV